MGVKIIERENPDNIISCLLTVETMPEAIVKATLEDRIVYAAADSNGIATLALKKEGLWTVSATYEGETKSTEILVEHNIEESLPFFPNEPSAYNQLALITASQTWAAPEDGWFQIEDFGASGKGGDGYLLSMNNVYASLSGGGGGGGGYACSRVKMHKNDTAVINIGAVGATTSVTINSTVESYSALSVTSGSSGENGANSSAGGVGGAGGTASGGNHANNNGGNGSKGTQNNGGLAIGGNGGAPGYTGGNYGGKGADGANRNYGEAGKAGFIKIYRGNSNFKPDADGVTRLNYIESTGTQYIDTGCAPSNNTKIIINLTPLASGMAENAVFGSTWAANGFFLMFYQNKLRWHSKGASVDISNFNTSGENEIECTPTKITVNGTSYNLNGTGTDTTKPITLFYAGDYAAAKYGVFKLHSCKIYEGDTLIKDCVPALDKVGVPCLYDEVNKAYTYNNGTGTFLCG